MPGKIDEQENESGDNFYQGCAEGKPMILIHDWLLSHQAGEEQIHKQAAEGTANSRLEVIENAAHGSNLTHGQELNKLLLNFLKA